MLKTGENNFIEFKSTLRYCLRNDQPEKYIEFSIAKTLNAFLNSEGGTLIIGVDDVGDVLGLDHDIASFDKKGNDLDYQKFLYYTAPWYLTSDEERLRNLLEGD